MANTQKFPAVTVILIGLNLAVAFAAALVPTFVTEAAFDPLRPTLMSTVASLFAHSGLVHLLANMIFLAAVGPLVEFSRGGWRLALIYVVAGLAGVGAHWIGARSSGSATLLMGASGAIAGCVGFCSIRFARVKVPVLPGLGVPVAVIAVIWITLQLAGLVIQIGEPLRGSSAFWAHLGGFLAGIVLAFALGGVRQARDQYGHELLEKMNARGPAATLAAAEALLKTRPNHVAALWQKATAQELLDERDACAATLHQIFEVEPEAAPEIVAHLIKIDRLSTFGSTTRLKQADRLASDRPELARELYSSLIETDPVLRPDALLGLAQLADRSGPEFAAYIDELQRDFALHPATEIARHRGWIQ